MIPRSLPRRTLALLFATAAWYAPAGAQEPRPSGLVHGFVREAETGEPIAMALVEADDGRSARTDRDGYFALARAAGSEHRIRVRAMGHAAVDTAVASGGPLTLRLRRAAVELAALTVEVPLPGDRPLDSPEVSARTLTPGQVRRVPAALEADVFRAIQALPGVVAPGAFSSRLLVRGGAADQNLFLLDGYPVIHPYHLTGAFSAFHLDAVRDVELWTGAPPARYGGRLSSVVDVALREGNRERATGAASVGLVSSAAVVEGPHARGAWFGGLRTTYLDVLTGALGSEVPYRFLDAYAKTYADLSAADRVSALAFVGRDRTWRAQARVGGDEFAWRNDVYGVSWRRLLGGRGVIEHRASFSRFSANLDSGYSALQESSIVTGHAIGLGSLSGTLRLRGQRNQFEAGWSLERRTARHAIRYISARPGEGLRAERSWRGRQTLLAGYLQDDLSPAGRLRVRLGVRGEAAQGGFSLQPRVAARYLLGGRAALTAGAGLLRQYDQLLQDPDANFDIYSADVWLTAGEPGVPVARSAHAVSGVEVRLPAGVRLRAEAYAKWSAGLVALAPYRPADEALAIERLQAVEGTDRGIDLAVNRELGRVRGWVGYSAATSVRRAGDTAFAADPHPAQRLVAVWDVQARRNWGITGRLEAFQGVPFTPATTMVPERPFDFGTGRFTDQCGATSVEFLYGTRNSARTGWSKRLDLGAGRRWSDRRGRDWEFSFSLMNALFDPTGIFRPRAPGQGRGCTEPGAVERGYEVVLPPIPSFSVRVEF